MSLPFNHIFVPKLLLIQLTVKKNMIYHVLVKSEKSSKHYHFGVLKLHTALNFVVISLFRQF